ncbi:P2X purinoceptor 3-like [Mustelus asterias]
MLVKGVLRPPRDCPDSRQGGKSTLQWPDSGKGGSSSSSPYLWLETQTALQERILSTACVSNRNGSHSSQAFSGIPGIQSPVLDAGILTGHCVSFNQTLKMCEVSGWCPVELDSTEKVPMIGAENFTIFIKNSIRFPMFNFSKGNLLPTIKKTYIRSCLFDPVTHPFCPIFRLRDIVSAAGEDFNGLTRKGGVLGIRIEWKCNLDWSADNCIPRYSFQRLDKVSQTNTVSQGYNFRYARFYRNSNGTEYRTLFKAYGIRIDIMVHGQASKFDIIPTVINMVAAFTSIGLGAVICDLILLNFIKGAEKYKAKKFEEVRNGKIEIKNIIHTRRSIKFTINNVLSNSCVPAVYLYRYIFTETWTSEELPVT